MCVLPSLYEVAGQSSQCYCMDSLPVGGDTYCGVVVADTVSIPLLNSCLGSLQDAEGILGSGSL